MARSGPHLWRALLLRLGFHLAALSLARRRSNARPGALSHPPTFISGWFAGITSRQPPQSSSEGCFLSRSGGSGLRRWGGNLTAIKLLPPWPLSADNDAGPVIVVGEVHHQAKSSCFHPHHPVKAVEIPNPKWLTIPERRLYTGVAIFGAVGSGKTSACMHPFAQPILSWQAGNPRRRAA